MSLFVPTASAAPSLSVNSGRDDHDHDEDTSRALLEVDGRTVPIVMSSVAGLESGSLLTVEVAVPAAVADAVAQGDAVAVERPADGGDEVVIPLRALRSAEDVPAPVGSDLAAATAVATGSSAEPVAVSVVDVAAAEVPPTSQAPHELTVAVVGVNGKTDPRYTDAAVGLLRHRPVQVLKPSSARVDVPAASLP